MSIALAEPPARLTAADYFARPNEGCHEELIDGRLWAMSPGNDFDHQYFSSNLLWRIAAVLRRTGGVVIHPPYDLRIDEQNVLQPDLLVFAGTRLESSGRRVPDGLPLLVVEIVSPGSKKRDYWTKRRLYARAGIPEYWVAEPGDRTISVFRAPNLNGDPVEVLQEADTLASPQFEGFSVPCAELWR